MVLSLIGSAGIGFVWGWMIGSLYGCVHHPQRTILAVSGATIPVFLEVWFLAEPTAVLVLGAAVGLALIVHIAWRRQLHRRFGLLKSSFSGGE